MTNEAFARIKIDQLLTDAAWRLTDGRSVRYEYPHDDGGRADHVLFDRLAIQAGTLSPSICHIFHATACRAPGVAFRMKSG
ncbi:hypothetical protein J5J86_00730 [Aquabacter sp. L1I39]|uniref:hypothetical protein n=1 Tax=Aquabacter sp. L1I39 TaxID=2820278 RepID=UPI001ADA4C35|nr:hypothetical protein [Aquabacter sp. L1I39]QTL03936.1 hypothetical protein J5J86_00730 [Aquabacter sp. L1I39]